MQVVSKDKEIKKYCLNGQKAAEWLSHHITVYPAFVKADTPHIIISQPTYDWYYFLDKYSKLTRRFTYSYANDANAVKRKI